VLDWSLEPDELGEDEELEAPGELELGVEDEPAALEELGELELGLLAEPLPLDESRLELEPDIEPEGDEEPEEPLDDPEREAPGPPALSQP
jgi:hypothetical protein